MAPAPPGVQPGAARLAPLGAAGVLRSHRICPDAAAAGGPASLSEGASHHGCSTGAGCGTLAGRRTVTLEVGRDALAPREAAGALVEAVGRLPSSAGDASRGVSDGSGPLSSSSCFKRGVAPAPGTAAALPGLAWVSDRLPARLVTSSPDAARGICLALPLLVAPSSSELSASPVTVAVATAPAPAVPLVPDAAAAAALVAALATSAAPLSSASAAVGLAPTTASASGSLPMEPPRARAAVRATAIPMALTATRVRPSVCDSSMTEPTASLMLPAASESVSESEVRAGPNVDTLGRAGRPGSWGRDDRSGKACRAVLHDSGSCVGRPRPAAAALRVEKTVVTSLLPLPFWLAGAAGVAVSLLDGCCFAALLGPRWPDPMEGSEVAPA